MVELLRRSWVEINLTQIQKNFKIYQANISPTASVMVVVKADAYGHGDVEVANALQELGVCSWAVSNFNEACKLRNAGISGEILILGYTPIENIDSLIENNITQAIISEEYAEAILKTGKKLKCQFAIDTGMNRIGLDADCPEKCIEKIESFSKILNLDGIFTHLCVADSSEKKFKDYTQTQIQKFEIIADGVKNLHLNNVHCLNSAGGLWHSTKYNSLVRLGIILYGLKPDYSNILPDGIKPALSWKSVVSMIKTVKKGEYIGYGCTFKADRDMLVATIPTGYADGYNRMLSNIGHVVINGKIAPIVGRVCMDQFMVDISEISNAKMGTEIELLSESYNADDMANDIGTIGYEIVCGISKRVPRVYTR